jgi:cell division protein FtsQ
MTRARRPRLHLRPRVVLAVVAVALLLGGAWLWLRDSSLVAVRRVVVTGVTGPDAGRIRKALIDSAVTMTTLDVSMSELRVAVAPYPVVKSLEVSTQFPHGMRIHVIEQLPVAAVVVAGQRIAVASDGTLLHDDSGVSRLPTIPVSVSPGGTRLTGAALNAVGVLAAAPYQLLSRISQVTTVARHGLVAQLRDGPSIYFGDPQRLASKWSAATAVLADGSSAGAVYIDVSDPNRPAAGAPGATAGSGTATGSAVASGAAAGTAPGSSAGGTGDSVSSASGTGNSGGAAGTASSTSPGG